jgi:NADH dehydrogenase
MILVTGANGFIGRSLMKALALREIEAKPLTHDINTPFALADTLADVDTVIHLASAERRGRADLLERVDVQGTQRLIEACEEAGVRRFILVSRLGADANAMFPLYKAKGQQELMLRRSRLPYTIIRSATLYGLDDHFLNNIVALAMWTAPFLWMPGGGRTAIQPLWVEDFVRCLVLSLARYDQVGVTLEVAGEERMSQADFVREGLESAGISRYPIPLPHLIARFMLWFFFQWRRYPNLTQFDRQRLANADITDLDSVRRQFGFRPVQLTQTIAYLRRKGHYRRLLIVR